MSVIEEYQQSKGVREGLPTEVSCICSLGLARIIGDAKTERLDAMFFPGEETAFLIRLPRYGGYMVVAQDGATGYIGTSEKLSLVAATYEEIANALREAYMKEDQK